MSVWFEGDGHIECALQQIERALEDPGEFFVAVTGLMPGLVSVELIEQASDTVTIHTNEGVMRRTSIAQRLEGDRIVVEFDERYEAGRVTTTSHFTHEFTAGASGVSHRLVISDVQASGLLGFLYRTFGSSNTGNALLEAHRAYFDKGKA